jgi:hypothetical protein
MQKLALKGWELWKLVYLAPLDLPGCIRYGVWIIRRQGTGLWLLVLSVVVVGHFCLLFFTRGERLLLVLWFAFLYHILSF